MQTISFYRLFNYAKLKLGREFSILIREKTNDSLVSLKGSCKAFKAWKNILKNEFSKNGLSQIMLIDSKETFLVKY